LRLARHFTRKRINGTIKIFEISIKILFYNGQNMNLYTQINDKNVSTNVRA